MPTKRAAARRDAAENVDIDSRLAPFFELAPLDAIDPPTDARTDEREARALVATPSTSDVG